MEVISKLRNCRIAPRKMQLVVNSIRGKSIVRALNILEFQSKKGAPYIKKITIISNI